MNSSGLPLSGSPLKRKVFPQTMKTLSAAITVLCILASTSMAVPLSATFGASQNLIGNSHCRPPQNVRYTAQFDSAFGGHWNLTGHRHQHADGTYTDSFRGTVSDTSIQGTFTRNDFDWLSDGWFLCSHKWVLCSSFSITISDGNLTGFATYSAR
jgi:hypothetical protein